MGEGVGGQSALAATDKALRMSYRIGRGEQGVLTFEPYKLGITLDINRMVGLTHTDLLYCRCGASEPWRSRTRVPVIFGTSSLSLMKRMTLWGWT